MFDSIDGDRTNLFYWMQRDFLKDKKYREAMTASVVYENYETAKSRVDFLYQSYCLVLPEVPML